ncbi:LysR family transcriptional regulator [Muribacter muris]|uniref:LysR family transcriptional regulator n=1 Tax=Muribacter muris TaxID=67855 RepID=A0A4Y9K2G9_9PAST|nr:LysR family transcriptional regulator [Muribacter muris]MBF0784675.1 LysR family transcriptional regulator [Muribacter muris]MBF0828123.1 LysR family transcriptional regulator [Muribacter muris]TFV11948.1 LysR family transcriptional regulator [Muribacter muris]
MDKLNAIQIFCKVIEQQSFTKAAEQSQMSLAMASKLVAQLEAHLNVRLLQRTTRKITPTEAGMFYYQRCLPILAELAETEDCMHDLTTHLQGKLTISVPLDFGSRFIAPHLNEFLAQHPQLQLQLDFSDRYVDLISAGYDLVLRIGKLQDSSIIAKRIGVSEHIIVAAPDYLAKFGTPQTALALQQHQCLLYESQTVWHFNENGHSVKFKPPGKVVSNNGYALVQMAKNGLGVILIPKFLVKDELASGALVPFLPHSQQSPLDISLLYPNRRYLSPKVKAAIAFFEGLVKKHQADL